MKTINNLLLKMGVGRLILFVSVSLMVCACDFHDSSKENTKLHSVKILNWNLQTFFDAADSGNEYEEFTGKKSKWTEEKYKARLEKLCTFMKTVNADIFCFMEVENAAVVQDIANTLQVGVSGMSWRYTCFARESGSSLGCAVFSRYEPESLTIHSVDCRAAVQTEAFSGFCAGDTNL